MVTSDVLGPSLASGPLLLVGRFALTDGEPLPRAYRNGGTRPTGHRGQREEYCPAHQMHTLLVRDCHSVQSGVRGQPYAWRRTAAVTVRLGKCRSDPGPPPAPIATSSSTAQSDRAIRWDAFVAVKARAKGGDDGALLCVERVRLAGGGRALVRARLQGRRHLGQLGCR
jgi:hypothetical protein